MVTVHIFLIFHYSCIWILDSDAGVLLFPPFVLVADLFLLSLFMWFMHASILIIVLDS